MLFSYLSCVLHISPMPTERRNQARKQSCLVPPVMSCTISCGENRVHFHGATRHHLQELSDKSFALSTVTQDHCVSRRQYHSSSPSPQIQYTVFALTCCLCVLYQSLALKAVHLFGRIQLVINSEITCFFFFFEELVSFLAWGIRQCQCFHCHVKKHTILEKVSNLPAVIQTSNTILKLHALCFIIS